ADPPALPSAPTRRSSDLTSFCQIGSSRALAARRGRRRLRPQVIVERLPAQRVRPHDEHFLECVREAQGTHVHGLEPHALDELGDDAFRFGVYARDNYRDRTAGCLTTYNLSHHPELVRLTSATV